MDIQQLHSKFIRGLTWNGFLFVTQKILFVSLSILLYKNLSTRDFSTWANINSVLFLLLLWIDCGFRKSVPRYAPVFAQNKQSMRNFVRSIILFQLTMLLLISPLFFFAAPQLATSFGLGEHVTLLYLGCIMFVTEGLVAILRLLFHSYFWQKQFNLLQSIALVVQLAVSVSLIILIKNGQQLVQALIATKIISGIIITAISAAMLKRLLKNNDYPGTGEATTRQTGVAFIKHSGLMWTNNNLKSLTERNFLLPLFTWILGPGWANLFKVANDGALLFQRTVLKTIGTTDTSLLSHIETLPEKNQLLPRVFKDLTTKIAALVLPLLGIILVWCAMRGGMTQNNNGFQLFFILTTCYLMHALLSPYERVLEVKRNYRSLLIAYAPYLFFVPMLIAFDLIPYLGLFGSVVVIHGVRLVSSLIMVRAARERYKLKFPVRFALPLFVASLVVSFVLFLVWAYLIK